MSAPRPLRPPLSAVVISTAFGTGGDGIFPYTLWPPYRRLQRQARDYGLTIFSKSATRYPRRGNFIPANPLTWKYIQRLPGLGMLNAYGLTNPGVEVCAARISRSLAAGFRVIPNFYPEFAKGEDLALAETLTAITLYRRFLGSAFWALELNFSCPNSREEIRTNVRQVSACVRRLRQEAPDLFLIAKLSILHPLELAQELEALGVGAIHAVNTIPYDLVFPPGQYPPSPLAAVGGGGVSGGPAFALARDYNARLRHKIKTFLIMGCGVSSLAQAQEYFDLGADAVSLCTLVLRKPQEADRIIARWGQPDAASDFCL